MKKKEPVQTGDSVEFKSLLRHMLSTPPPKKKPKAAKKKPKAAKKKQKPA